MRDGAREIFTANGMIVPVEGGLKRFVPSSPRYVRSCIDKIPAGKKVSMTIAEVGAIRSGSQLRYHWVLMGYLAEHTGFTKEEMHDAVMRLKFGEKEVRFGSHKVRVRKSISNEGRMPKHEVVDLITYDLELCAEFEIHVPTAKELGYLPG